MDEFEDRALTRLAELGMALAEEVARRAQAAGTPREAEGLALAFERIARSVRLTFALRLRLRQERAKMAREAFAGVAEARRKRVRRTLEAVIAAVPAIAERVELSAALDERLDEEALDRAFVEGPVEACVARIRQGLGLPPEDPPAAEGPGRKPSPPGPFPARSKDHSLPRPPDPRRPQPVGLGP